MMHGTAAWESAQVYPAAVKFPIPDRMVSADLRIYHYMRLLSWQPVEKVPAPWPRRREVSKTSHFLRRRVRVALYTSTELGRGLTVPAAPLSYPKLS